MSKIDNYSVIGVMSGTSLDGLDIIKCTFQKDHDWSFKIEKGITNKYSENWLELLKNSHEKKSKELQINDNLYGDYIGKQVGKFIKKNNFNVDLIASHGHTIFHQPENKITMQIGNGQNIANITNTTTISDFRSLDVKLNGQGAPLVPIGDLKLFQDYKYCLNLGGFANISIKKNNKIIAYDICPANIILNYFSKYLGKDYDKNGLLGQKGICNNKLLKKLNKLSYYKIKNPKSLSREWLENNILNLEELQDLEFENILATFYEHIGFQIGKVLKDKSVLITGGGTHNHFLIKKIKKYSKAKIMIPSNDIVDFKEALIFGFLGVLKLRNEVNCLKDVTGADRDNVGGEIFEPNYTN
jgi:anhydro-N-acetylmuramic acid kinase